MERANPTLPASIPVPTEAGAGVTDVSLAPVTDSSTLDNKPDARANPPKPEGAKEAATTPDPKPEEKKGQKKSKKK
jgi:hypothetical protein